MNVVDSSAWLEYFGDGPNAAAFAGVIEAPAHLAVPTLVLYEVFKRMRQLGGEDIALDAVAVMQQSRVVELSTGIALDAARISADRGLPMADAVILATTLSEDGVLWTQDAHFADLPGVEYRLAGGQDAD